MSYRQCRNLCEMLRSLNYSRLISLENFSKPNFELVADILYWLTQKYDPQTELSDDINQEKDRIEFMKAVVTLFATKARIKLNPKKLYQADGQAVQQILKIVSVLYKASNTKGIEEEEAAQLTLPTKVSNLKAHKNLCNQICDLGTRLYDAISRQPELKQVRNQALSFLEGMGGVNSDGDQAYIQRCVRQIMEQQNQSMQQMTKYVSNMERQQKNLEEKLKKKSAELDRAEKRYRGLITVKPAFMEEYERLEQQLEGLYQVYVEKYRNIDYLEQELEKYNKAQEEKLRRAKLELEKIQAKTKQKGIIAFKGEQQLDGLLEADEERGQTRGKSRRRRPDSLREQGFGQKLQDSDEEEQQDDEQSGDEIEDDENDDEDSDF